MAFKGAAIISVHDVMPENFPEIEKIIDFLYSFKVKEITLLIVPGKGWGKNHIKSLKKYQETGITLAAHGWRHLELRRTSIYHKIHGMVISRNEAEHLSLSEDEIMDLIKRSYFWFEENYLYPPDLYVPPAWAMGKISKNSLSKLPFSLYETQTGIYDAKKSILFNLPVTGYMADNPLRSISLRFFNLLNMITFLNPIRIAIHPRDLNYPLACDLKLHLGKFQRFLSYREFMEEKQSEQSFTPFSGNMKKINPKKMSL